MNYPAAMLSPCLPQAQQAEQATGYQEQNLVPLSEREGIKPSPAFDGNKNRVYQTAVPSFPVINNKELR